MPARAAAARATTSIREDVAIPLFFAIVFFYLQARYLHEAAMPDTDEGVYAQVGRLMLQGLIPHLDFAFFHMPLLPLFAGVGGKVFHGIHGVRLLFLLLNSFAVIPLYLTFLHVARDRFAAAVGVFFYLTYHEMVHHDFRFLAIRQLGNDLFIAYVFLGTVVRKWRHAFWLQTACAAASALLFLPSLFNLGFVSLALTWRRPDGVSWKSETIRYATVGLVAFAFALAYLAAVPGAFRQIVLDQMGRSDESKMLRISHLPDLDKEILFYALSTACLVAAASFRSAFRPLSLAMLGVVATALLLSSNFYPHYLSIAGPAFAFGVFFGVVLLDSWFGVLGAWRRTAVVTVVALAVSAHACTVLPSLLNEWTGNRHPEYAQITAALRDAGSPVLAMQPVYAVSAGVDMVDALLPSYIRPPVAVPPYSEADFERMAAEACSILLDGSLRGIVPGGVIDGWSARYEHVVDNSWATVLRTRNPLCPA